MSKLGISLVASAALVLLVGCPDDPEEPNAFQTQGDSFDTSDTMAPMDMPNETGTAEGTDDDVGTDDTTTEDTTTETTDDTTTTTDDGGAVCGNGTIDDGEQCDGGNLGGFTCVDLGYSGGTLACDPVTCTYDASGCVNDPDGGGGTSG